MRVAGRSTWPPRIWIGGGQGAGKSTLAWRLWRAHDRPLHSIDGWTYDHHSRMPAEEPLEVQLARGAEAAADAFVSHSMRRLELVLDDVAARHLGHVPALVEGPQLMPGCARRLDPGWCIWLLPDLTRTAMPGKDAWLRRRAGWLPGGGALPGGTRLGT